MSITLELPTELEQKLRLEAKRAGVGDSEFAVRAIAEGLANSDTHLSDAEKALLREIDRGFSDS